MQNTLGGNTTFARTDGSMMLNLEGSASHAQLSNYTLVMANSL